MGRGTILKEKKKELWLGAMPFSEHCELLGSSVRQTPSSLSHSRPPAHNSDCFVSHLHEIVLLLPSHSYILRAWHAVGAKKCICQIKNQLYNINRGPQIAI